MWQGRGRPRTPAGTYREASEIWGPTFGGAGVPGKLLWGRGGQRDAVTWGSAGDTTDGLRARFSDLARIFSLSCGTQK